MREQQTQNFKNHARLHPPFHFFFTPAVLVLLVSSVVGAIRHPGLPSALQVLLVLVVGVAGTLARTYALKVQDRLIRLEERIRLATLLPGNLAASSYALSEAQLIALRFASDEELPALAERARRENLTGKAIKAAIVNWRPDHWRV